MKLTPSDLRKLAGICGRFGSQFDGERSIAAALADKLCAIAARDGLTCFMLDHQSQRSSQSLRATGITAPEKFYSNIQVWSVLGNRNFCRAS
jgi:hypothetical protein